MNIAHTKRLFGAIVVLLVLMLAAGCTSSQPPAGYVTIRSVDIGIPDGQPPSNVTRVTVVPYLDAVYADVDGVDLQVSAKEAGTDIVVEETVRSIGTLTSGKTVKKEVTLTLENSRRYGRYLGDNMPGWTYAGVGVGERLLRG